MRGPEREPAYCSKCSEMFGQRDEVSQESSLSSILYVSEKSESDSGTQFSGKCSMLPKLVTHKVSQESSLSSPIYASEKSESDSGTQFSCKCSMLPKLVTHKVPHKKIQSSFIYIS